MIIGIDPGIVNNGFSIIYPAQQFKDYKIDTEVLVLRGSMGEKLTKMTSFLEYVDSKLARGKGREIEMIGVETLRIGAPSILIHLWPVIGVICAFGFKNKIKVAMVQPSTHYWYISGKGRLKDNDKYARLMEHLIGKGKTIHEMTATSTALAAYSAYKGNLPEFLEGKIEWADEVKRKPRRVQHTKG